MAGLLHFILQLISTLYLNNNISKLSFSRFEIQLYAFQFEKYRIMLMFAIPSFKIKDK